MAKFKKGDIVVANKHPDATYSVTIPGWKGKVVEVRGGREIQVTGPNLLGGIGLYVVENKYFDHYKTEKMAKKTTISEEVIVFEGDYFSATYGRKKIRGIVNELYDGQLVLQNSQGIGDEKCEYDEDSEFSHGVLLSNDYGGEGEIGTLQDLKDAGVTNYVVLKDKRQKAIIDMDRSPEIWVSSSDYKVSVNGSLFSFGCGAVELTKAQIEGYMRWRKKYNVINLKERGEEQLGDLTKAEVEEYFEYDKDTSGKVTGDYKLYQEVVKACFGQHDEDELLDIEDAEIEKVLEYYDHIKAGV